VSGAEPGTGIEIVTLAKRGGPLTKRISLDPNGKLVSDGSACVMGAGTAWRTELPDMTSLADHIAALGPQEAIALGRLRDGLPDKVTVTTKARLNGATAPAGVIARTGEYILYEAGAPALLLVDVDTKGMPGSVRARIKAQLGTMPAIASVVPELGTCGCVVRNSTTTGLSRTDTGEALPGSEGRHLYLLVQDGADIERALRALHDRLWLAGCGWFLVGAAGQLLDRSLADRMVFAPERLVFEAAPVIDPPLVQDIASRMPRAREGDPLDTATAIPDLTPAERVMLDRLKAAERERLRPEGAKARAAWIDARAEEIEQCIGVLPAEARAVAERAVDGGVLLPDFVLPFDDPDLAGKTVGDVLADPDRFVGQTMADPQEGIEYGRTKAIILRRPDGSLWIHSYAHGRAVYDLKLDADRLRERLAHVPDDAVIAAFVRLCRRMADIGGITQGRIREELTARLKVGKREFARMEKAAIGTEDAEDRARRKEARQRASAEVGDTRPQFDVPPDNTPFHTVEAQLDSVFATSDAVEPPMRDIEGCMMDIRSRRPEDLHELTAKGANAEESKAERLPAPDQTLMTKLTNIEVARAVERYIDYITPKEGISVRLPSVFVNGYRQQRFGSPLPTVTAVATMPVLLRDGTLLSGHRLDRERGILFRVPDELQALLPQMLDCTDDAIAESMHFLCDDWLCDVPTDYPGKLKAIALACTILQRVIFPERPAWFVTSGQRGNGKTTLINMISIAVTGQRMCAAAWSSSSEERRKALLAYLGDGVAAVTFDNLKRGTQINDPHVDKILTGPTHTDRLLGVSENRTVPALTILIWTGNNVGPKGETASRSLVIRLTTRRPDPENRPVRHLDPLEWTRANRGLILRHLYTVLLGSPRLRPAERDSTEPAKDEPQTRFKLWWHCIGAAIQHAATCHRDLFALKDPKCEPVAITFRDEFLANETSDEQTNALALVLGLLRQHGFTGTFAANDLLRYARTPGSTDAADFKREFFDALETSTAQAPPPNGDYSSRALTHRLAALVDATAEADGIGYTLRYEVPEHDAKAARLFSVEEVPPETS
jgi:hypothetical protein